MLDSIKSIISLTVSTKTLHPYFWVPSPLYTNPPNTPPAHRRHNIRQNRGTHRKKAEMHICQIRFYKCSYSSPKELLQIVPSLKPNSILMDSNKGEQQLPRKLLWLIFTTRFKTQSRIYDWSENWNQRHCSLDSSPLLGVCYKMRASMVSYVYHVRFTYILEKPFKHGIQKKSNKYQQSW